MIGKKYFYEHKGTIKQGTLTGKTKAWYIFDNGDWIESWQWLYETKEELLQVKRIVETIEKNTHVPDVILFGRSF